METSAPPVFREKHIGKELPLGMLPLRVSFPALHESNLVSSRKTHLA